MSLPVHIVIEPGSYSLQNMGDVAMLQVAVRRLRLCFPSAEIRVLTHDPAALAVYCPEAVAQNASGRAAWVSGGVLLGRLHGLMPAPLSRTLSGWRMAIGHRWPALVGALIAARLPTKSRVRFREFLAAVRDADLFLIVGQGAMNDATRQHAETVLATLNLAQRAGVPTVMMGQGIGPLHEPGLAASARAVLPRVRLIALREQLQGPSLLTGLGVPGTHMAVTGDDAVELAYEQRRGALGSGLGINLRVSTNAGTDEKVVYTVREAIEDVVRSLGGPPVVPAPIARGRAHDADVIGRVTAGLEGGTASTGAWLDSPTLVITRIADCRVLVTGAYHAAVFALAQGIPVVCLEASEYYVAKFNGLLDLFPGGGEIVPLHAPGFRQRLSAAVHRLWDEADNRRSGLLRAAAAQVAAGNSAYARLAALLSPDHQTSTALLPGSSPPAVPLSRLLASDASTVVAKPSFRSSSR